MILAAMLLQPAAWAETCKYTDSDGRVIYSNTPNSPPKGATKVKCFEDPTPKPAPPPAAGGSSDARPSKNSDSGPKSRVNPEAQKRRDDDRRRILEQELADESRQLDDAKKALAEQEAVRNGNERNYERFLARVQPYKDAVTSHENNVEAIKREIANLK
ncbi:MAG TPA: DUF4124 domain-containing protein [Burkholderiales bacterium]|nr:DUF4124 domain-containing protein [Burkholderiales bacterium]